MTKGPFNHLAIGIVSFALMIIAGLWLSVEKIIERAQTETINEVIQQTTNLARVFEEHTIRTLTEVDQILLIIKRQFEAEGEAFDLPALWAKLPINPAIIRNGIITDPSGFVILGSMPSPSISLADREHINVHFMGDTGQVFIGKPVESRINRQWSIGLSRRANKPDGSLMGVASIAVNPFYFSDLYKEVDIGRAGRLSLVGLDGIVRVMRAEGPTDLTLDVSPDHLLKQYAIAPNGFYIAQTESDGVARIFSYRKVQGYPLLVVVGVSKDETLGGMASEARLHRVFAMLASIAVLAFTAVLIAFNTRARRHQVASEKIAAEMTAAKDAAETAGKLLHDIADRLPVLIAYLDTDRRFRFINKTGELWFARPAKDILGKTSSEVKLTPLSVDTDVFLERLSRGPAIIERTFQYPDGVVRMVESMIVPEKGPDGSLRGYYRLSTDVTERKRLNEQLRESQKMEAIGHLTGGIAHDFNNLLMVIIGNLDNLSQSDGLPPKMKAFADAALRASKRGADLTRQLLTFARRQSLSPTLIDLNVHVGEIAALLRRTIPEAIAIDVRAYPTPVMTMVDAGQLENALLNLALNARDAMNQGGQLICTTEIEDIQVDDVSGTEVVPAGRYAVIKVRDTGTGMPPEVIAQAFEPFFTTKPTGQGTGLGLSMVYGFARQSGGHVQMFSTLGKGTEIRLLFPLAESFEKHPPSANTPLDASAAGTRRRILVVEDKSEVLTTVADMLVGLGYDTVTAVDGHTALRVLSQPEPVDGMLTDIGLPGELSGFDLADIAAKTLPNLKIATMSGYTEKQKSVGATTASGQQPHLRKPFLRTDLFTAMNALFPPDVTAP